MPSDALYPLSFDSATLTPGTADYLKDPTIRLTVDFFRNKGLEALKQEDRAETWYSDWIEYQSRHGLYADLLTPRRYSNRGHSFSMLRLARCAEVLGCFSPAHGYSLQSSFLGLFPILLSSNEALKKEAIAKLEDGGLFSFAVSEKAHGSDLFANEFTVTPTPQGSLTGNGEKYYIGNANVASLVTTLGKQVASGNTGSSKRAPFIFFALRPQESPAYGSVRKITTIGIRSAFVGEFKVKDHPLPERDIISQGRDTWEAVHATVNIGKFLLGFGAVGICEHAFVEALAHMNARVLFGKRVTDIPHIRATSAIAFARLAAMKLYAYRALDYVQVARNDDRRFLLFNAVQKAKVSTEGVKVVELLSECIGARGFEAETYFESALREAQMIPSLEGSTHINFGLTSQYIDNYFAGADGEVCSPASMALNQTGATENPYWFEAPDRTAKTVRFASYLTAYEPWLTVANVQTLIEQLDSFRLFAVAVRTATMPAIDTGLSIALGKCLATIAYGQLVAEQCRLVQMMPAIVSVIFHALIEDLSAEALKLSAMYAPESASRDLLARVVRVPATSVMDLESVSEFLAAHYGA